MTTVRWWRRIAYALTTILLGVLLLPPVYRWVAGTSFGQISGRYFNAVGGQKFTQWVRAIVPREIDRGLTLGEVTEDASLYVQEAGKLKPKVLVETLEVKTKEPIIILWGVKIGEIEKVEEKTIEKRQVLKAGTKVKVWQARPNLVFDDGENDEPVLKVKIADESGEFITSKEELYVVARKVRLTSPLPAKADMRPTPWYHHLIYLLAMIVGMWMIMNLPPKEKLGRRITWVAMTVVMLPMAVYMLINMIDAKAAPIPTRTTTVTTTRIGQPVSGVIGPPEYVALVDKYLAQYPTVPRNLALAMIQVESSWDPRAVSPRGAQGLMQLMPDTARLLGVSDPFDPDQNIRGGIQYLAQQLADFSSTELALVAYHWGPENVRKHPGKTWEQILASSDEPRPGPLTIDYVRDVIALARGQAPGQPGVQMAVTPPPPPPPKEFEISFGLAEGTTYETVVVTCTTDSKVETAEMTKKRPYWGFKITPATRCVAQDEAGREIKLVDSKGQLLPTGFQPKPNLVAWVQ
ncbi:MAG: transglycosylase SLT domain-containing protein [Deltaproteobacteria bacterium]|nr:transglycosylase SLT domain-containing protein [Deltaproteobacteria bacterium]